MMATTANQRIDVGALRNGDAVLVVDAHANERQEIAATLRYNYDQLGSQGAAIREHAIEIKRSEQQANSAVVEAGRHLLAVKEALPHGQWETWLETEFHMTDRTARTLMNIAERFDGKTEIISVLNVTVLGMLAAPSVPDAAVEAVAAAASNGKVSVAAAKEIIAQHQPARPYLSIEEVLAGLRSTNLLDGLTGRQVWEIAHNDKHERFIACQKAITGRVRQHELINALYKIAEERGTKFDGTPVRGGGAPQGERSTWDYWAAQGWRLVSDKTAADQSWPHLAGLHDNAQLATPRLLSEAAVVHWLASGGKLSDQNYRDFAGYDTIRPAAAPGRSAEIETIVRRQIERQGNPITVGDLRTIAKQRIGRLWRDCLAELPNSVQFSELSRAINSVADMLERTQPPAPPLAAPAAESTGGAGQAKHLMTPTREQVRNAFAAWLVETEPALKDLHDLRWRGTAASLWNSMLKSMMDRCQTAVGIKSSWLDEEIAAALQAAMPSTQEAPSDRPLPAWASDESPAGDALEETLRTHFNAPLPTASTDPWLTAATAPVRRQERAALLADALQPWIRNYMDEYGRDWEHLARYGNPSHTNSTFWQDIQRECQRRSVRIDDDILKGAIKQAFATMLAQHQAEAQAAAPAEEDNQEPPAESAAPPLEAPGPLEIEEALWPCVRQDNAHIDGQIQSTFPGSAAYWAERVGRVIGKPITAMQMAAPLNRVFQALLAERASQPGFVPLLKTPPAQLAATEAIAAGQLRQMQIEGLRSELNDALGTLARFGDITGKHTETLVAARELRRLIQILNAETQP